MRILLTADWHLRGDAPVCRKDPGKWLEEQAASVQKVKDACLAYRADQLWIIGDLFHRARTSTEATVQALELLGSFGLPIKVLVGNHDELYHQYANVPKSTIGTVFALPNVKELTSNYYDGRYVEAYPFGTEPTKIPHCEIWCTHQLVFPDEASRPAPDVGVLAEELLERSDAKLIITGDYHHGSIQRFGDRSVVTCGCLNIQARDMADYEPRAYLLETSSMSIEEIPLGQAGDLDLDSPQGTGAADYVEAFHLAALPRLDFMAAVEAAVSQASADVQEKVQAILDASTDIT